ncbi:GMC oxidoreductase-domain-containing protein [Microdochium bolleyi]|uniref:GMC oxidoreductase-domain-containing protein n=1 Tax=Microdochium bolleyi TaxID=196109 RepID=A0A136IZ99_9PEZI|nr:GMC oxidoreductase-domain-containing protein [Microdochium bolleyi]
MPLYQKDLPDGLDEFDVIIAGGGSAGCVVAGRVAAADPSLSVLLIESGRNNYMNPAVMIPAMYASHLLPNSESTIFYSTNKSKHLAGREVIVPAGNILGGGSSTNFMMYTRAQRSDYDSWQTPGWSTDELLPYLKKLETYHGPGDASVHGSDGPIVISDGTYRSKKTEDDWLQAAAKVGYPEIRDLQDLSSNNGFQRWLRYVNPQGIRSDAAHGYVHPLLNDGKHPNFYVLVEAKVVRVLFDKGDEKRACGVEYEPNVKFHPLTGEVPHVKNVVKARKQVVISCGSCSTPTVLERSGLGDAEILKAAGVPLVEHLPGVGADYQDHNLILYAYSTNLDAMDTLDGVLQQRIPPEELAGHPHLGWNSCDIASKVRPTDEDVDALGPEFRAAWDRDFRDRPDRPIMLIAVLNGFYDERPVPPGQYITLAMYTAYPYSRGHVHITGRETTDRVDFELGFLNDEHDIDLKKHVWAYKKGREIMRRTKMHAGEVDLVQPKFAPGSKVAAVLNRDKEHDDVSRNLEYSADDDAAIEQYIRENVGTTWHSLGTARMCPRDRLGVVDERCSVYGVKGLKIADLSIVPLNIGANTNNTALLIGEKVADFVIQDLGLKDSA